MAHSYVSHEKRLVALWSPKCACTAAVEWFVEIGVVPTETLPKPRMRKRAWLEAHGYDHDYRQSRHLVQDRGYVSVQFTRHPAARAASAFIDKLYCHQGKGIEKFEDLEVFSREFVMGWNERHGREPTEFNGISFQEYLEHVEFLMTEGYEVDFHWDTQLDRDTEYRIQPDYVVRQESFKVDLQVVNKALGFGKYLPGKKNATKFPRGFTPCSTDMSTANTLSMLRDRKLLRGADLRSPDCLERIRRLYAEDYAFFCYEPL